MRIYYFSQKKLLTAGIIMVLALGFLSGAYIKYANTTVAAGTDQPIFQGNTGTKAVALTVNVDWGEEFIPAMLEEFKKNNALATFFVTGRWAEKNPELLKQMAAAGHSIQNHGYKHVHFNQLSPAEVTGEIKKAEDIIFGITGTRSSFFASPYGEYNPQLVRTVNSINYQYIMWSADTIDWQRPDPGTIVNRVIKKVHNDAIVLMHPTEPTVKALPEMLKQLKEQNYQMITIDKITAGKIETGGNTQ
ncbi:MAG: polysaccharide deacetylase family protein [Syntrophomonadaceae bacterium]|nr:polysaccharide deacetylase family protein [Syntrophomonadaceae bacterium]